MGELILHDDNENVKIYFEVESRNLPVAIKRIFPGIDQNDIVEISSSGFVSVVFNKLMKKFATGNQGHVLASANGREIKVNQHWVGGELYSNRYMFSFPAEQLKHHDKNDLIKIILIDFVFRFLVFLSDARSISR